MLKFPKRDQQPQLPGWRSDWLYTLIFQQVEGYWDFCKKRVNLKHWQYVLVEEWSAAEGSHCRGKLLRSWIRDKSGLREISLQEHSQHKGKIRGRIYPFVKASFHVYPERTHVVLCHQEANTAGGGARYIVIGDSSNAKLEFDPSGGFWRS